MSVLLGVTGCGFERTFQPTPTPSPAPAPTQPATPPPTPTEPPSAEDAARAVEAALEASHQVRTALEVLGLVPDYECGAPRSAFLAVTSLTLSQRLGCVTTSVEAEGLTGDALVLRFVPGCEANGHVVSGEARFVYRGGADRMEVEADLRQLTVDDEPLNARAGYGTCGHEKRVWAEAEGTLPRRADVGYRVDVRVGIRDSAVPLIGGTTLVFDGQAELRRGEAVDLVRFDALEYEVGDYLPKGGGLLVETSDGHVVSARFSSLLWKLGKAHVAVDGGPEVTVPVVH